MAYTFSGGIDLQRNGKVPPKPVSRLTELDRLILLSPEDAGFKPDVKEGDEVGAYQRVGTFEYHGDEIPVFTALAGKITRIVTEQDRVRGVIVSPDGSDRRAELHVCDDPVTELSPETVTGIMKDAAIPCRGSYGYAYRRVLAAEGGTMRFILNCCESEPGVFSRRKLIDGDLNSVIDGAKLLMRALDVRRCEIAVEADEKYYGRIVSAVRGDPLFEVHKMKRRYPQDEEVAMIYAVTGTRLSDADHPERSKCCVFDAEVAAAVYRAAVLGIPYCERIVSVNDENVLCPVGAPVSELLDFCGITVDRPEKIILGGPMRGKLCKNADDPIGPLTDAVTLFFPGEGKDIPEMKPCTHCGRCVTVCPSRLLPYYLAGNAKKKKYGVCEEYGARACTGCGCCDYVCPAYIPIKKLIHTAKRRLPEELDK